MLLGNRWFIKGKRCNTTLVFNFVQVLAYCWYTVKQFLGVILQLHFGAVV